MSAEAIECAVSDVANLIPARTYVDDDGDGRGKELGEFSDATHPTAAQVKGKIKDAAIRVQGQVKQDIEDDDLLAWTKAVVARLAAMGVELGYFPEQANQEDSAYKELKELYDSELADLLTALPDSSSTRKGFYSLRTRSDVAGVFPTSELLP
jgi:hypothetical protein